MLCSRDGEELGLLGSTEWAEDHARELHDGAVAYLNVDAAVTGEALGGSGVPSLENVLLDAARDVTNPRTGASLYDEWLAREKTDRLAGWKKDTEKRVLQGKPAIPFDIMIGALGSGSDYTAFLDHLGVPCLDFNFSGPYGVYHSIYDNLYWMEHFGDPEFLTHATAARLWGTVTMRLADAPVLPFAYSRYAQQIGTYVDELQEALAKANESGKDSLRANIAGLLTLCGALRASADSLTAALKTLAATADSASPALERENDALIAAERALLEERGLPGRAWYKHQIYAPGYYTGYAALPLPGPAQAIKVHDQPVFASSVTVLHAALERLLAAYRHAELLARR